MTVAPVNKRAIGLVLLLANAVVANDSKELKGASTPNGKPLRRTKERTPIAPSRDVFGRRGLRNLAASLSMSMMAGEYIKNEEDPKVDLDKDHPWYGWSTSSAKSGKSTSSKSCKSTKTSWDSWSKPVSVSFFLLLHIMYYHINCNPLIYI